MITLAWYLLKVIICSGILCGYYFLALRNKAFHRWNRFYILLAVVISLLAPIMTINIFQTDGNEGTVVQMLQTISYGDEAVIEYSRNSGIQLTTENMAEAIYLSVSIIFLLAFFISLNKIRRLRKKYPETKIEDISFINTDAKGTPFSFFRSVFWNNSIDLHSRSGQQIFNHEIAHIKEKHSYDKIFMNSVLIFFWINPFFWLMRKELYMIHEFIADKEALEDSDIAAFAEMILQTVYPGQHFSSSNSFFYSPVKRRILMLTKNKNPKVSYISRLLVLPLAAIVFFAFTLKVKDKPSNYYDGKTITVVIDAGHGGMDNGAVSADGIKEKDITLAIAKKIAESNSNSHIQILLSRNGDQTIPVKGRIEFAKNNDADVFISLHVNAAVNQQLNGFSVLIDKENTGRNQLLGSALIDQLKKSYRTEVNIGVRNNKIGVLDENVCPAALVEFGFLSNSKDMAFISQSANQEKIAENVLEAINNYASTDYPGNTIVPDNNKVVPPDLLTTSDTIPVMYFAGKKVKSISVQSKSKSIKGTEPVIKVTYEDDSTELISKEEADKRGFVLPPPPPPGIPPSYFKSNALFVIDGAISTNEKAKKVDPESIQSISILKDGAAIKKYGDRGKNGVIEITTKKDNDFTIIADTFHIGKDSSLKPASNNLKLIGQTFYIDSKIPEGVLIFADGKEISQDQMKNIPPNNIQSVTILKGESAIEKYGGKAKEGSIEIITKENTATGDLKYTRPDRVFSKVEVEAHFPGGPNAWQKYITQAIVASIDSFTEKDYGTCIVKFIVNTDGTVSNIEPTTMKGTTLAKISVNAIKDGPKWIPASQNGHTVAAYRLQPVTLTNPENKTSSTKTKDLSEPTR